MTTYIKKFLLILPVLCFITQVYGQNEQINIRQNSSQDFSITSANGIPFTVVLENSKKDGQYLLASDGELVFNMSDITPESTARLVFQRGIYDQMEEKVMVQYRIDVEWIKARLGISDDQSKLFPTRPIFDDPSLEKLKQKVYQYTETPKKEAYFNEWIDKINYSYGVVLFLREMYAASNGTSNGQSHNFTPVNLYQALRL